MVDLSESLGFEVPLVRSQEMQKSHTNGKIVLKAPLAIGGVMSLRCGTENVVWGNMVRF